MEISVQQHVLPAVIVLVMITVGMELRLAQFRNVLSAPKVPVLGTLVHTFSFPVVALLLVWALNFLEINVGEATLLGMLLIAACPSGGFSNILTMMAKANLPLSIILTAVSSILSFITVPLLVAAFAIVMTQFNEPIQIPVGQTLVQLVVLLALPVTLGMVWRAYAETFVVTHAQRLQSIGQAVLYVTIGLLVAENWAVMIAGIGDALPWSILLCVLSIGACYGLSKLLGLEAEDAITVALEGSIRNLAVAFVIAANVLERMDVATLPTIYFITVVIVAVAFAKTWRRWLA